MAVQIEMICLSASKNKIFVSMHIKSALGSPKAEK